MRIIISLIIFCSIGWSQVPLELSLAEALERADENNLTLKKARVEYQKSISQKKEAKSSAWPVISTFAQGTKNLSIASQPLLFPIPYGRIDPLTGTPVPLPGDPAHQMTDLFFVDVDIPFGQDNTLIYGFTITQPLFDGRVIAALRSADTYETMAKSGLSSQENAIVEQTTTQYYRALVAARVLKVMKTALDLAEQHLRDARALYAVGNAAELSVIQAGVRVANAETQVSRALKNMKLAKAMLKRTCGIPPEEKIDLIDNLEIPIKELPSYEELSRQLLINQPVLTQLKANQKLMQENILLKKAEFMPSLVLTGNYSQQLPYNDGQFDEGTFRRATSVGISLSYPLFNGFGSKARLDQAKANYQSSGYTYKDTENALLMELSQLYFSAKEAATRIKAGEKQVALAHRGAEIAESLYQKGMNTDLEYQDAVNGLRQAELGLAQAYFEYHTALAGIRRSTGINDF